MVISWTPENGKNASETMCIGVILVRSLGVQSIGVVSWANSPIGNGELSQLTREWKKMPLKRCAIGLILVCLEGVESTDRFSDQLVKKIV